MTRVAGMVGDPTIGISSPPPARIFPRAARPGEAKIIGAAPPPAATKASTNKEISAARAATPPPVLGVRVDSPLMAPGGLMLLEAVALKIAESSARAPASLSSAAMVDSIDAAECAASSRVTVVMQANFDMGP